MLATVLEAGGYATAHAGSEDQGNDDVVAFRPDALIVESDKGRPQALVNRLRGRTELARCGLLVISARIELPLASEGAWAAFTRSFDLLKLHAAVAACSAGAEGA